MSVRPPAPLPLPAASPPATWRWLHASITMRALACLALCMDRVTIALRRHGDGQCVHGIILAATIGAEQPQLASSHGRTQRRPGTPWLFPPWARWALCRWLRICRLAPLAARPPLGGRFARASRSLRCAWPEGCLGRAWCVARCGVGRGRSAELASRLAKFGGVECRFHRKARNLDVASSRVLDLCYTVNQTSWPMDGRYKRLL